MRRHWPEEAARMCHVGVDMLSGIHVLEGVMGKEGDRNKQQCQNYDRLPSRSEPAGQQMGIPVAGGQQNLEKQQAGGPDSGTAAEPGQDVFGEERLNQKQQECAQEDRCCINDHRCTQRLIRVRVKGREFHLEFYLEFHLQVGRGFTQACPD